MGNKHVIYSQTEPSQDQIIKIFNDVTDSRCPWANASMMTIGDVSVPDLNIDIDFVDYNIIELQKSYFSNVHINSNPRGPPTS